MNSPLALTGTQRRDLKARAHALEPVVMIGNTGLTDAVVAEIDRALAHHELIKIRVLGDDRAVRAQLYDSVCERSGAAPVQHIGKILVLYRPKPVEVITARPDSVKKAAKIRPKPKSTPKRILGRAAPKSRRSGVRRRDQP